MRGIIKTVELHPRTAFPRVLPALALLLLCLAPAVFAGDWLHWRGPSFNSSTEAKNLPGDQPLDKNILWAIGLPGEGASTPIVSGDRIFLTSTDKNSKDLYAMCLHRQDGRILWSKAVSTRNRTVPYNNDASPSPVADGQRVYFMFGNGELLALDYEGKPVWSRNLEHEFGPLSLKFLYCASPLLYHNRLYIAVLRDNNTMISLAYEKNTTPLDSFLLCVDPKTGKTHWKQPRHGVATGEESRDSYASPIPCDVGKRTEILAIGAGCLTGHDWRTGKENWRLIYESSKKTIQRVVTSPVVAEGMIIASKPRQGPIFALAAGGSGKITYDRIAWEHKANTPDVPSPLAYHGRLYYLHDSKKVISCVDPKSGRKIWEEKLDVKANFHASPSGADGKIYCLSQGGEVIVLAAGDQFKILSRTLLGGAPCHSSIAIAHDCLFVRTAGKLFCIGKSS